MTARRRRAQALFAPVTLGLVVGAVSLSDSGDREYAQFRMREDWIHPLGKCWALWLSGSALSYLFVPTPWQPPLAWGLALAWNALVSYRVHQPKAEVQIRRLYVEPYLRQTPNR